MGGTDWGVKSSGGMKGVCGRVPDTNAQMVE